MSAVGADGYANCQFYQPSRFDTYLVKTVEGCYDFAHYANGEWAKGVITGGTPFWWMEIPQKE